MDIIFDEKPGEVFDFFKSLWFMNNYETIMELKKEYGIDEMNEFEKAIIDTIDDLGKYKKEIERYFYIELKPEFFTGMESIWAYSPLENYLEYCKKLDEYDLIMRADQTVQLIQKNVYEMESNENESNENAKMEDIEVVKERILDLITNKDIPAGLKWEVSLYLSNPKKYMNKLRKVIYRYFLLYKKIVFKREEILRDYNKELKENLNSQGIEYLLDEIEHTYDFSKFKEIKVTTTALTSL